MADAPGRPRPRPRPRAKAKSPVKAVSSTLDAASSPTAGPSSTPTKKPASRNEAELDAMFMKNRNRSLKTWHKLEEQQKVDDDTRDVGSNSESDENISPRSRKRVRKQRVEALPKPKWQKDKELLRMLSAEPDEDSDLEVVDLSDPLATPTGRKRDGKRKRQRSRSRSITPPPTIPLQQVENVKKFVRQALGEITIPDCDDGPADANVDRILRQARQQTPLQSAAVDEEDTVQITVIWKPHPLDAKGEQFEWQYQINRSDNFRDLFEAISEDATIITENLVVCYEGKRIFSSVGPAALNIWQNVEFTAYAKSAFEYIRSHPELTTYNLHHTQPQTQGPPRSTSFNNTASPATAALEITDSDDDDAANSLPPPRSAAPSVPQSRAPSQYTAEPASEAEDDDEDTKFKLTLRSAVTGSKDIVLTVRPATKCGSILKAFLRKAGLEAQYPQVFADNPPPAAKKKGGKKGKSAAAAEVKDPRLCVDGDRLDNESPIADADLEDGDLVEVVGL